MKDADELLQDLFDRCTCCPYDSGVCAECQARGEITRLRSENSDLRSLVEAAHMQGLFRDRVTRMAAT